MSRIQPDDRPYYQQTNLYNQYLYFFVQGNEVVMVPAVGANPNGSLIFSYYLRPNELVDISLNRIATINSISVSNGITSYTVDQIPTGFNTSVKMDILQTNPGHKTHAIDKLSTLVDTTNKVISFNSTDVSPSIVVGDYVAYAGECIIPQIPSDLHDVLAQRVALRCLQSLGDQAGYAVAGSKLQEMEKNTGNLIDNRTEAEPTKLVNRKGLLRSAKIRRSNGWI